MSTLYSDLKPQYGQYGSKKFLESRQKAKGKIYRNGQQDDFERAAVADPSDTHYNWPYQGTTNI